MNSARRIANTLSTTLLKQPKIFVSTDAGRLQVVANDENRNFVIGRNYDWPRYSLFEVGTVAAFLSYKLEAGTNKNSLESLPINGLQLCHGASRANGRGMSLGDDPRRAGPAIIGPLVARLVKHLVERTHLIGCSEEKAHGFIERHACCVRRLAGARDVQRHCVCHELIAFFPNADGVINPHCSAARITSRSDGVKE
jgi:hypothetical protein